MGVTVKTDANIINGQTHFNTKFVLSSYELEDKFIPSLENLVTNMFTNSYEYILSIRQYPFGLMNFFSSTDKALMKLGKKNLTVGTFQRLKQPYASKLVASFDIVEHYKNSYGLDFMDYAPYTSIQLYLVFLGFVELPVNVVMGRKINVYYAIDFDTGKLTAYVTVVINNVEYLILTSEGVVGVDIPIGQTNSAERQKNLLMTGVSIVGGLVEAGTGNEAGAVATAVRLGTQAVNGVMKGSQEHAHGGQIGDAFNAQASPRNFFLRYQRKNLISIDDYAKLYGRPLMQLKTVSSLRGFTTFSSIHIESLGSATSDEKDEIENLLMSGVIL